MGRYLELVHGSLAVHPAPGPEAEPQPEAVEERRERLERAGPCTTSVRQRPNTCGATGWAQEQRRARAPAINDRQEISARPC